MMIFLLNPRLSFVLGGLIATIFSFYLGAALAAYALPGSTVWQNLWMLAFFPAATAILCLLALWLLKARVTGWRALQVFAITLMNLVAMVGAIYLGYAVPIEGLLLGALTQALALTALARRIWRDS